MLRFIRKVRDCLVNLRGSERQAEDHPAVVSFVKAIGHANSFGARCRDRSEGGLGVLTTIPFPPGALVRVDMRGQVYYAEVRRCVKVEGEYFLGLQFTQKPRVALVSEVPKLDLDIEGINVC